MKEHRYEEWTIKKAVESGEEHLESIKTAVRNGVNIAMGTDIPPGDLNDNVNASVREVEFLNEAGLDNLAALKSATVNAAKLCRTDQKLGVVSEGYMADLIAIPENPLEDICSLRKILFVMKEGQIIRNNLTEK